MSFVRTLFHSLKNLLRTPVFAMIVIALLSLGIAASTAMFTLLDELLLFPFPYREPNQLVMLWESNPALSGITANRVPVAWANLEAWRNQNHTFEAIEAFQINMGFNLTGLTVPEHVTAARATPAFFQMLGINPAVGRTFLPGDDAPGANPTVVLTHGFSRIHFGDSVPLGRVLVLDDVPYTVIGVLPDGFHLPALSEGISEYKPDLWVPVQRPSATDPPQMTKLRRFRVCARIKPGISISQAEADLSEIAKRRAKEDPPLNQGYGIKIFSLKVENTDPDLRNELHILFFASLLVLVLGCISAAGLMLIRTSAQIKRTAIMAALGANRWALIAPFLSESSILALISAVFGFVGAYWGIRLIAIIKPSDIHAPERLNVNPFSFAFAVCVSALTVLIFGLIPAFLASTQNLSDCLKATLTGVTNRSLARTVFVSLQIAVTMTLAIDAILLIRSFRHVLILDLGFRPERVLTAHLSLPPKRYPNTQDRIRFCEELRERLQSIPGVESAAIIDNMPLYAIRYTTLELEGRPLANRNAAPISDNASITPGFFHVVETPIRQGRFFTDGDAQADPPNVVIVNEALARQLWPDRNPIGTHIRQLPINASSPGPWQTVIGVVADFHQFNTETPPRPELFWPSKAFSQMTIVLRLKTDRFADASSLLQQTVWKIDHDQPLSDIQTLEHIIATFNSQRRFNTLSITAFAAFSIFLTLVGLWGLISSFISSRLRDIGIRLALGAHRKHLSIALIRPGLFPILTGIALGLIFSLLTRRLVASVLFHVSPLDLGTYIIAPLALATILTITALSATFRAARIDPAKVLRQE